MTPRTIQRADMDLWADRTPQSTHFTAPGEVEEGIEPCPGLVLDGNEIAVAWTLDEIELTHLARGGTLWLVCRGGLPVHCLLVSEPPADERTL